MALEALFLKITPNRKLLKKLFLRNYKESNLGVQSKLDCQRVNDEKEDTN